MVDVSLLTNKLQIDDIKLLTVNTLNSQIKITKEELKSLSNEIESLKIKVIAVLLLKILLTVLLAEEKVKSSPIIRLSF